MTILIMEEITEKLEEFLKYQKEVTDLEDELYGYLEKQYDNSKCQKEVVRLIVDLQLELHKSATKMLLAVNTLIWRNCGKQE